MSYLSGSGLTPFGKLPGKSALDLMSDAATLALNDAGLERKDIDGLLCGYATTFPHLMLSTVFAAASSSAALAAGTVSIASS